MFQVKAVSAFAQTLRRYTSLNHLAQAARAVLQNTTQINQMLADLNRVDFTNVQVRIQGDQRQGKWTFLEKIREKSGNFILNQGKKSGNFVIAFFCYLKYFSQKKIARAFGARIL